MAASVLDGISRLMSGCPASVDLRRKGDHGAPSGRGSSAGAHGSGSRKIPGCPARALAHTPDAELHVSSADEDLRDLDVIVTAMACLAQRVFDIMKVKPSCVIADVARPPDLPASEVAKRPDVLVIESGESGVALGPAQKRRGAFVTGSARPPRSTLTRSYDGPRHTLPAMTQAGSQGNRSLLSATTRTTGDKGVGAPDTAAAMSSRVNEMPVRWRSGARTSRRCRFLPLRPDVAPFQ